MIEGENQKRKVEDKKANKRKEAEKGQFCMVIAVS